MVMKIEVYDPRRWQANGEDQAHTEVYRICARRTQLTRKHLARPGNFSILYPLAGSMSSSGPSTA